MNHRRRDGGEYLPCSVPPDIEGGEYWAAVQNTPAGDAVDLTAVEDVVNGLQAHSAGLQQQVAGLQREPNPAWGAYRPAALLSFFDKARKTLDLQKWRVADAALARPNVIPSRKHSWINMVHLVATPASGTLFPANKRNLPA